MNYRITAIKKTVLPKKAGGTWTKIEIKTDKTGDDIYEFGQGHSTYIKETAKVGDTLVGYIENKPWNKSDGTLGGYNKRINGITPEYVYKLLLSIHPDIESAPKVEGSIHVPTMEEEGIDPNKQPW